MSGNLVLKMVFLSKGEVCPESEWVVNGNNWRNIPFFMIFRPCWLGFSSSKSYRSNPFQGGQISEHRWVIFGERQSTKKDWCRNVGYILKVHKVTTG